MTEKTIPGAWVELIGEEEALRRRGGKRSPYDFGVMAPMGRLLMTHPEIGPAFGALFVKVMFGPGALSRAEREMVAGVAAAAQDCHY